ncbi:MAG: hypothetical protein ABSC46_03685 [Candidatus Limnocylindrales bacterium]|jgi:hypothetical protein
MVEFIAYAADCRVYGQIELGEGRLSDQLDHTQELLVRDAQLEDLADGHVVAVPELVIEREELCAVVASGPRGDMSRRLYTWTTRAIVEVGPYRIEGRVHGRLGSTPLGLGLQRLAWMPLTEATVEYHRGADEVVEEVETLLVNREVMRSYRDVAEVSLVPPWEAQRSPQTPAGAATDSSNGPGEETRTEGDVGAAPPQSKPIE